METTSLDQAGAVFVTPAAYEDERSLHSALSLLRRESPIHLVEHPEYDTFWALTRHADIMEVEQNQRVWINEPGPTLMRRESARILRENGRKPRALINLDEPEHRLQRAVVSGWFLAPSIARLDGRLSELSARCVERLVDAGGELDFAREIAMPYPLQVILAILGLPEEDYPLMLRLTQELFGNQDPDIGRGTSPEQEFAVLEEMYQYFIGIVEDRRKNPTDDLASVIANATIDGQPLGMPETLSHLIITAAAGHDTTSAAMAGGMLALLEHPEELAKLQKDPSLMPTAVEEMLRWVTPVKHFMRTASAPYELRGHQFAVGDRVLMSYPSANRDHDAFPEPFRFDVGRTPNRHLAFGFGGHFCLGAGLARMEMRSLFSALLPRLGHVELADEPQLIHALLVGGLKSLPIRYELT